MNGSEVITHTLGYIGNSGVAYVFVRVQVDEQLHCFNIRACDLAEDPEDAAAWIADIVQGEHLHPQIGSIIGIQVNQLIKVYNEQNGNTE